MVELDPLSRKEYESGVHRVCFDPLETKILNQSLRCLLLRNPEYRSDDSMTLAQELQIADFDKQTVTLTYVYGGPAGQKSYTTLWLLKAGVEMYANTNARLVELYERGGKPAPDMLDEAELRNRGERAAGLISWLDKEVMLTLTMLDPDRELQELLDGSQNG